MSTRSIGLTLSFGLSLSLSLCWLFKVQSKHHSLSDLRGNAHRSSLKNNKTNPERCLAAARSAVVREKALWRDMKHALDLFHVQWRMFLSGPSGEARAEFSTETSRNPVKQQSLSDPGCAEAQGRIFGLKKLSSDKTIWTWGSFFTQNQRLWELHRREWVRLAFTTYTSVPQVAPTLQRSARWREMPLQEVWNLH